MGSKPSGQPVPASDQYGLAITAYQLLIGSLPFQGRQEQVMYMHFHTEPKPPSTLNPHIPKDIDAVILRALASSISNMTTFCREIACSMSGQ